MPIAAELTDVALFGVMDRYGDLSIHALLDLGRTFTHAELSRALELTIRDFPVIGRRYEKGLFRDRWVPVAGPVSDAVHFEAPTDLEERTRAWVRRPLDPTRERQVRIVALETGGKVRLILSILHLAVDGAGIGAVGHVFGSHLLGRATEVPSTPGRRIWNVLEGLRWFHAPRLLTSIVTESLRPLRQLAAAPRTRPYDRVTNGVSTWRHMVIGASDVARLRESCSGATVNDILISAMASLAAQRSHGGPVVVLYTMDLRRYAKAPRLIAANSSSILSAIVPRHAVGTLAGTTRAVAEITREHRETLAGPAFLLSPYLLAAAVPHAAVRALTAVFGPVMVDLPLSRGFLMTNVGRIDEGLRPFGDLIERVRIVGPLIRGVSVPAVVAFGFRGEIHLEIFAGENLHPSASKEMERELCAELGLEAPRS